MKAREIAASMVTCMALDNGCKFYHSREQEELLIQAVQTMQDEGCTFTDEEVELSAAGEHTEMHEHFQKYTGWPALHAALEAIFNGKVGAA